MRNAFNFLKIYLFIYFFTPGTDTILHQFMHISVELITLRHCHNHSGKKWGIWEAPCREMLVFGGKFWNLEGNCAFFVHKK